MNTSIPHIPHSDTIPYSIQNAIISFLIVLTLVFVITTLVLRKYVSFRETPKFVYFWTFLGYFFSIFILFLMPVDIVVTTYMSCREKASINDTMEYISQCPVPFIFIPSPALIVIWNIIYWTAYVATWLVYPIMQSYVLSGEFTMVSKIKAAIKENLIFYCIGGILCLIIFIILCISVGGLTSGLTVATTTANLWGLFLLIALLGYGLVNVPRSIWRRANMEHSLEYSKFRLATFWEDIENYRVILDGTLKLIKKYSEELNIEDENMKYLNEILQSVPKEYYQIQAGEGNFVNNYSALVDLHAKLKFDVHQYTTAKCLFEETFKEAIYLEDTIRARKKGWKAEIVHGLLPRKGRLAPLLNWLEWAWSLISPFMWRTISVLLCLLSLALIWSETIFPYIPDASAYAALVRVTLHNTVTLQVLVFVFVSYIGSCTYSSLFQIKIFNYYQLLPHQRTDGNSILFSAAYLSRLASSICLNFLHVINYIQPPGSHLPQSPFFTVMQSDPVQDKFYVYFPIVLALICLGTFFNVFNYLAGQFSFTKRFQYATTLNSPMVSYGDDIMQKEKKAMTRGSTTLRQLGKREKKAMTRGDSAIVELDPAFVNTAEEEYPPVPNPEQKGNKLVEFFRSKLSIASFPLQSSTTRSDDSEVGLLVVEAANEDSPVVPWRSDTPDTETNGNKPQFVPAKQPSPNKEQEMKKKDFSYGFV